VFAYIHPSGDAGPSPEDIELSQKLIEAEKLLGIPVLNHLILGVHFSGKVSARLSVHQLLVQEGLYAEPLDGCLAELGFARRGRHFVHPDCKHLFVEFVAGPLGIGDDLDITPTTEVEDGHTLRILSPTDCVRDRLASYIHFKARDCLNTLGVLNATGSGPRSLKVLPERFWTMSEIPT
jgi:hypothetical protein